MNLQEELYQELANCENENDFVLKLVRISNEINKKSYLLGIEKKEIINFVKEIRKNLNDDSKDIWTKNVASSFGMVLKQLNFVNKVKNIKPYLLESYHSNLHKLGQLYQESFEKNKIIKYDLFQNIKISGIDCGGSSVAVLTCEGDIYTLGAGGFGQLGHGNLFSSKYTFKKVSDIPKCKYVTSGYAFTSAITLEGEIYSWGAGDNGRLGTGNTNNQTKPTKLNIGTKFKQIAAGSVHLCAISEDNELYSCGEKKYCGHGNEEDTLVLTKIHYFDGMFFKKISIGPGGYHTLALNLYGDLFTWGHNRVGQLGLGNNTGSIISQEDPDGDHINPIPEIVTTLKDKVIVDISAGWGHSAVLDNNNNVYMCGRNTNGQLGFDPKYSPINVNQQRYISEFKLVESLSGLSIVKVVCGGEHTACITKEGRLYIWGDQLKNYSLNNENYNSWEPFLVEDIEYVTNITLGSSVTFAIN